MRRLLTLLLVVPAVAGPATEPESYDSAMKRIAREQRNYRNNDLSDELGAAINLLTANWTSMTGKPETPNVYYYDISGFKNVFDTWADFERQTGKVAEAFASKGGPDAAKKILDRLCDALDEVVAQEKVLPGARAISWGMIQNQEPAVLRYGACQCRDVLVAALGKLQDAEGFAYLCNEGWGDACRWDKRKRSELARIAVLDALALTGNEAALPLLEEAASDKKPQLRIAGIEGLAQVAKPEAIAPRLAEVATKDPCYAVRAAALDLLAGAAGDAAVVPALIDALQADRHAAERARVRRALSAIVGTDLGPEPTAWRSWVEAKAQGKEFKPEEARLTTADAGAAFDRPAMLLECTYIECMPADIELAAKRNWFEWFGFAPDKRTFETQWDVQKRDAKRLIDGLGEDQDFSLLVMRGLCEVVPFDERGFVRAKTKTKRKALKFLDAIRPGIAYTSGRGNKRMWIAAGCSPCQGLWATYAAIGLDPWNPEIPDEAGADAILYSADGFPNVGPILHIEATIDDIRRLDRFFRIPVHCVRVGNTEGSEETLKGIAEATRGSYEWRKKP